MERWQVEMDERRLGVVEAKDEDKAVDTAAQKFRVPPSQRHKILVSKADPSRKE